MLAGSSTFLSPRHRLSSEAAAQFQACHFPSMSTQRLDLPCNFGRKDAGGKSSSQLIRPVGLSIEKPAVEASGTGGRSLRQGIKLPPTPTVEGHRRESKGQSKNPRKRYANEVSFDEETCSGRTKRKKGDINSDQEVESLSLGRFARGDYWFQPGFSTAQVPFTLSSTGEDESMCYMPAEGIVLPLPPLSNIPWFDSVVTGVTDFEEKKAGTSRGPEKELGSSSTSSDSQGGLVHGQGGSNPVECGTGNGSNPTNPNEAVVGAHNGENNHMEHACIELISLLVSCVEQIVSNNIPAINHCLARLGELASTQGSPVHRLVAYYTEALALRVARQWPNIFSIAIPRELDRFEDEIGMSWRFLNHVSPIPKFIHFTLNEILLRAFEGKDRVHIIDFDIQQGLQWPSLFQSLASRTNPPSHVRITGVGESKQELIETGERLAEFAGALNLPFEFHSVVDRLEDVRLWMLHVKDRESVAINCVFQMHKMLHDSTGGTLNDFLGLLTSTRAEIVVMAEQEAAHNEVSLSVRFTNSLKYYSAIFDSIDSTLPFESQVRTKVEEMFAREIRSIIACEGRERLERHETFGKWKQLMDQGRFRNVGISEKELLQGKMLLRMYTSGDYSVEKRELEGDSAVTLSWLDQPLYTVSAWSPIEAVAGTSYSQPR